MRALARVSWLPGFSGVLVLLALGFAPLASHALPSYAKQTGLPCAQCHSIGFGPSLTQYGREFKLNGYTFGSGDWMPFAAMAIGNFTHTDQDQPGAPAKHFFHNDNTALQEAAAFFAGGITEHTGAFVEATYSGVDRNTAWDNIDLRYARPLSIGGVSTVSGISINNSPTVQDLWNSTPAWSFPYTGPDLAPAPAAAPLIADALAQTTIGATAYTMINDRFYLKRASTRDCRIVGWTIWA